MPLGPDLPSYATLSGCPSTRRKPHFLMGSIASLHKASPKLPFKVEQSKEGAFKKLVWNYPKLKAVCLTFTSEPCWVLRRQTPTSYAATRTTLDKRNVDNVTEFLPPHDPEPNFFVCLWQGGCFSDHWVIWAIKDDIFKSSFWTETMRAH